jgi:hypothetical protein
VQLYGKGIVGSQHLNSIIGFDGLNSIYPVEIPSFVTGCVLFTLVLDEPSHPILANVPSQYTLKIDDGVFLCHLSPTNPESTSLAHSGNLIQNVRFVNNFQEGCDYAIQWNKTLCDPQIISIMNGTEGRVAHLGNDMLPLIIYIKSDQLLCSKF